MSLALTACQRSHGLGVGAKEKSQFVALHGTSGHDGRVGGSDGARNAYELAVLPFAYCRGSDSASSLLLPIAYIQFQDFRLQHGECNMTLPSSLALASEACVRNEGCPNRLSPPKPISTERS